MQNTTIIELPEKVNYILNTIMEAGYEAYAVGGCIRDSLLHRKPDDWDITTSATPRQVKALFERTLDTGIRHGTVTVMLGREGFEVTTYRIDGEYEDGRHPREVTFTASLEEDLRRRDFTINAMAYNEKEGLVDLFEGREDMAAGRIRCVGDPKERFGEDALRMMRAVRFSAQLGYQIEPETAAAIAGLAPSLSKISAERIQNELVKLLVSPHPDYLRIAWETGITAQILPEFDLCMATEQRNPHHCYPVGEHTLRAMAAAPPDKILRLSLLFHDMGKPACLTVDEEGVYHFHGHPAVSEELAVTILHRLKFDNLTLNTVRRLVRYHDYEVEPTLRGVRRAMGKVGEELFPLLLSVKRADIMAQSAYHKEEKLEALDRTEAFCRQILSEKQCVSLKRLAVNGRDLMEHAGVREGKAVGEILQKLLLQVIEEPSLNEKEKLLKLAEGLYQNRQ